ncbi:efflux transporter periplasmic adaptor subunit, partial [Xanthomonas perforans]
MPGRSGTCAAALLITTSLLLGGCKAGEGQAKTAEEKKAVDAVPV